MKIFRFITLTLTIIITLFIVIGLFLPKEARIERSITIEAPIELVFDYVNNVEKQQSWSPWKAADPSMKISYSQNTSGEGAQYRWDSDVSGQGTLTITSSHPFDRIDTRIDFSEQGEAFGWYIFEQGNGQVKLTEGFRMNAGWNIPSRYFGLVLDELIGEPFEKGLQKLKQTILFHDSINHFPSPESVENTDKGLESAPLDSVLKDAQDSLAQSAKPHSKDSAVQPKKVGTYL